MHTGKPRRDERGRFNGWIGPGAQPPSPAHDSVVPERSQGQEFDVEPEAKEPATGDASRKMVTSLGGLVASVSLPNRPYLIPALETLDALHRKVPTASWTVVGGLMVNIHCVEAGLQEFRATEDMDIAVDVFTSRPSLRRLTEALRQAGYVDITTDPTTGGPRLSYRWERNGVKVDLMVPENANAQRQVATTASGRPAVEMPAVQQAVQRSELVLVSVDGGEVGLVRRPNLAGAVVIKSVAAVKDKRAPARHYEDLVLLGSVASQRSDLAAVVASLSSKDRKRVRDALARIPDATFRTASDPAAARSALELLAGV